jgi:hypothetical protein
LLSAAENEGLEAAKSWEFNAVPGVLPEVSKKQKLINLLES